MKYKIGDRVRIIKACICSEISDENTPCWDNECRISFLNKVGIIYEILHGDEEERNYRVQTCIGRAKCRFSEDQLVLDIGIQTKTKVYGISEWCKKYYK